MKFMSSVNDTMSREMIQRMIIKFIRTFLSFLSIELLKKPKIWLKTFLFVELESCDIQPATFTFSDSI